MSSKAVWKVLKKKITGGLHSKRRTRFPRQTTVAADRKALRAAVINLNDLIDDLCEGSVYKLSVLLMRSFLKWDTAAAFISAPVTNSKMLLQLLHWASAFLISKTWSRLQVANLCLQVVTVSAAVGQAFWYSAMGRSCSERIQKHMSVWIIAYHDDDKHHPRQRPFLIVKVDTALSLTPKIDEVT